MPARYLPEGNQQDHHQSSPSPRSYDNAREVPPLYAPHYGYAVGGAFAHRDPGAAARAAGKSCSSTSTSTSSSGTAAPQFQQQGSSSEPRTAMWRNNENATNGSGVGGGSSSISSSVAIAAARPELFHGEISSAPPARPANANTTAPTAVSVSAPSRSPSPSAVSAQQRRDHPAMPAIELTSSSSPAKKSDWENLLGAVDLELRAQERAELVPDSTTATAVPSHHYAHAINAAHLHHQQQQCSPLHPSSVGDGNGSRYTQSAAVSPEFGPIKSAAAPRHHRRGGGDAMSGGGPAYSGSTADAACLLATLPQRMLDRAPKHQPSSAGAANAPAVGISSGGYGGMMQSPRGQPALVSASGPSVTPVRVQASGRRGPRGQSRFKGVCITRAGKWRAVIYIGRKQKYLGVFDSEFDAARAYDAAALEHFAEGAKLNFPDGIEQQLNDISSGDSGRPFTTAGAGGPAAPRSTTPPAYLGDSMAAVMGASSGNKRSRKSAFGEDDDDEWVRDAGPWNSSRI